MTPIYMIASVLILGALAACSNTPDEITIRIEGLPEGAEALIAIDTPEGERIFLNQSATIGNLTLGEYTVRAGTIAFERRMYEPEPAVVTFERPVEQPIIFTYQMDESKLLSPGARYIDTSILGPIESE